MAYPKTETSPAIEERITRFERRCSRKKSEGTAKRYASAFRQFAQWTEARDLDLDDVETEDVEDYLWECGDDGYAEDTVKAYRAAIIAFYDEQVDDEDDNPARDVDFGKGEWSTTTNKKKATREDVEYLEPQEVQQLIENVPEPSLRNRLVIRLMFTTGVRVGELVSIRVSDVDRDERTIQIHTEKSDSYRTVVYPQSLNSLMALWMDTRRGALLYADESPYLFPTDDSVQMASETVHYVVREAAEKSGLQETYGEDVRGATQHKISPHTLRHSFAVNAITQEPPMPIPLLKNAMGHSDIDVTQIYLKVAGDDVEDAYRKYGPRLN